MRCSRITKRPYVEDPVWKASECGNYDLKVGGGTFTYQAVTLKSLSFFPNNAMEHIDITQRMSSPSGVLFYGGDGPETSKEIYGDIRARVDKHFLKIWDAEGLPKEDNAGLLDYLRGITSLSNLESLIPSVSVKSYSAGLVAA